MTPNHKKILLNGLWHNNPALVQILGLCPLLAVSNNAINALGLGIATLFVMLTSNLLVCATRHWIRTEIRIPVFVLLIASAVTVAELLIKAFAYSLYQSLGIYLALIVTNCAIIARAEAFAIKNPLKDAALDGFAMGLGFAIVLFILGSMREIIATGSLFAGAERLFGSSASALKIEIWSSDYGVLLAALPAGAFIAYALLIALKNAFDDRQKQHAQSANPYHQSPEAAAHTNP